MEKQEVWLPVIGHETRYQVSDRGRIKVIGNDAIGRKRYMGRLLSPAIRKGYPGVTLWTNGGGKNIPVHIAASRAFLGEPPPGHQCNHKDGDKANPTLENLEYVTASSNYRHALDVIGHQPAYGETHWAATASDEGIRDIRNRRANGAGVTEIALSIGKEPSWVCKVCLGHIRGSAGGPIPPGRSYRKIRTRHI